MKKKTLIIITTVYLVILAQAGETKYKAFGIEFDEVKLVFIKYPKPSEYTTFDAKLPCVNKKIIYGYIDIHKRHLKKFSSYLSCEENFKQESIECCLILYGFNFYNKGKPVFAMVPNISGREVYFSPDRKGLPFGFSSTGIHKLNDFVAFIMTISRGMKKVASKK